MTGNRAAATRAGLLTAVLGAPIHLTAALLAAEYTHPLLLTTAHDLAAHPHSGYPDVASYLLSDAIAGNIIGLAVTPLAMSAIAVLVATVTPRRRRGRPSLKVRPTEA